MIKREGEKPLAFRLRYVRLRREAAASDYTIRASASLPVMPL